MGDETSYQGPTTIIKENITFKRCKLVVGGSEMALKILADDPCVDASFCNTCSLSIHGFFSVGHKCSKSYCHRRTIEEIASNSLLEISTINSKNKISHKSKWKTDWKDLASCLSFPYPKKKRGHQVLIFVQARGNAKKKLKNYVIVKKWILTHQLWASKDLMLYFMFHALSDIQIFAATQHPMRS